MDRKQEQEIITAEKWSNDNEDAYHFWYGVISDFPLCCIIYFCDSWINNTVYEFSDEMCLDVETNIQHNKRIMCPDCIVNGLRNINIRDMV